MFYALRGPGLTIGQRRCLCIGIERTKFPPTVFEKAKVFGITVFSDLRKSWFEPLQSSLAFAVRNFSDTPLTKKHTRLQKLWAPLSPQNNGW